MSNSPKRITGVKSAHRNHHLFSNHYLDNLLPRDPDWEAALPEAKEILSCLQDLYSKERKRLPEYDELQLEERWFKPILSHLAHVCAEHPRIKPLPRQVKAPDYVFFPDDAERQRAAGAQKTSDYSSNALAVGEVKRWDVPLGRKEQGGRGAFEAQNPSVQIAHYVRTLGLTWGVLTNGRLWRLVHKDTSQRLSIYYEIDLVELLSQGDAGDLRYFTLFFRQAAFKPDARGRVFLDDALGASREHTLELEEYLKENAQRALERLMQGFLDLKDNGLGESDLPEVYDNSLHLLYRLFFILYAESRGLLPLENDKYRGKHSLRGILEHVGHEDAPAAPTSIILWTRLQTLFRIVNGDAPELNSRLVVPRYSGGLFNPNRRPFLEVRAIGDQALAETLDLICRRQTEVGSVLVDYRTLNVRNLGSILGELLEYRPHYASKSMVAIRSRKGVHWIVERSVDRKDSDSRRASVPKALDRRDAGQVYLETDRGMAKATGSHYTPHHIVAHIVENTVGPLLEEAKERVSAQVEKRRRKSAKAAAGQTLAEEILSLKVLDPAVGSAQFLLEATELLALELATDPYVESSDIPDDDLAHWRRRVVERCIYGVDKNPLAVELAKLSLWLATVSADRPLVYLDHHLRCGDSLLGARVADLGWAPPVVLSKKARTQLEQQKAGQMNMFEYLLGQQLPAVMARILEITDAGSDSYDTVQAKEAADQAVRALKAPFEAVANLWVGAYFGGEVSQADYEEALGLVGKRNELLSLLSVQWAQQMARKRRFFHWEMAFPEVFYDHRGQPLGDRAGFDAVVGNPPNRALFATPQTSDPGRMEDYLEGHLNIQTAIGRKQEPCWLFVARTLTLLRKGGRLGFIVPLSLVADAGSRSLRRVILEHHGLIQIDAFPNLDDPATRVFPSADLAAAVLIIEKGPSTLTPAKVILHPGNQLPAISGSYSASGAEMIGFNPRSFRIPLFDSRGAFVLAGRLSTAEVFVPAGELIQLHQGELTRTMASSLLGNDPEAGPKVCGGDSMIRYGFLELRKQGTERYLDTKKCGDASGRGRFEHTKLYRIGCRRDSSLLSDRRLVFGPLPTPSACLDSIYYHVVAANRRGGHYLLALLNSTLLNWRFRATSLSDHVSSTEIAELPLRRIEFATPPDERAWLKKKAQQLYETYVHVGDEGPVLTFVDHQLRQEPEHSDVIHDLLAYLAERMIAMHKERQSCVQGFWLDLEGAADPQAFKTLRTKGKRGATLWKRVEACRPFVKQESHSRRSLDESLGWNEEAFVGFAEVLVRKLSNLADAVSVYRHHRPRYRDLVARIEATDRLIDQVVYKLYGLTRDEIAIVEGRA